MKFNFKKFLETNDFSSVGEAERDLQNLICKEYSTFPKEIQAVFIQKLTKLNVIEYVIQFCDRLLDVSTFCSPPLPPSFLILLFKTSNRSIIACGVKTY